MSKYTIKVRAINDHYSLELTDVTEEQLQSISDFMSNPNTTCITANNLILSKIGGKVYVMGWRPVDEEVDT